ncbi:hypothetical protein QQF64_001048 [Cirrhinus molitorella]|uniref:Uncharacterized protein n=1 Tax=Cirrhinus molitorella TaxID=172907 RepID=A0ABR3NZD7_9TELE
MTFKPQPVPRTTTHLSRTLAAHINATFLWVLEDNHGEQAFEVKPQERPFELHESPHLTEESLYLHLIPRESYDHFSVCENNVSLGKV